MHIDNQPQHYIVLKRIRKGVSTKVYVITNTISGARYIIKKVDKSKPKIP